MAGHVFTGYRRANQAKVRQLHVLPKQRGVDAWSAFATRSLADGGKLEVGCWAYNSLTAPQQK